MDKKDNSKNKNICDDKSMNEEICSTSVINEKYSGAETMVSMLAQNLTYLKKDNINQNLINTLQRESAILSCFKFDMTKVDTCSRFLELYRSQGFLKLQEQQNRNSKQIELVATYINNFVSQWSVLLSNKEVSQRSIPAFNLAVIRTLPEYTKFKLPYGSKKVLKSLSKDAAEKLIHTEDILFDPKYREFYHKENPEQRISADQITVLESSQDIFSDISLDDLISFESKLFDGEAFAYKHPVGEKIIQIIEKWDNFIDLDDITYYHARKIDKGQECFLEQDMMKAPNNVTSQGRYNHVGKSCYYICETKDGAINEVLKHCDDKNARIQVIGLRPIKKARIIDLSQEIKGTNKFIEHIRLEAKNDGGKVEKNYLLPNFVASCCREYKIDGIKYKGRGYNCVVLWKDDYFMTKENDVLE